MHHIANNVSDQPLKEHARVARTNRPYKDVKEAGYILDYIGMIKGELERALEISVQKK